MNPDLLPGASADIRAAVAVQLARVNRQNVDSATEAMATTSAEAKLGRPLEDGAFAFACQLVADANGLSLKRVLELAHEDETVLPKAAWQIAAIAADEGCRTLQDFAAWLALGTEEPSDNDQH